MDDASLLRAYARDHSEAAFRELVARHVDLVYSAALRRTRGDPHRAEEVTQMVFTDLARKAARLLDHPLLAAWLHQATHWAFNNLRRSERRRAKYEHALARDPSLSPQESPAEPTVNWAPVQPLLDEALDALSADDRAAVLQRFFQQQPFAAIAARLGVSENTARMRVERALEKLRTRLARHGLTSTSAALGLALAQHSVTAAPPHLASTLSSIALTSAATTNATGALGLLLMTKTQLGLATAATLALAAGFLWQHHLNATLRDQLTTPSAPVATSPANPSLERDLAALDETLRQLDAVLTAASITPALTQEQQERQQLETFIRKGELDGEFSALFRKLRLPVDQLDGLKTLLVEYNQARYNAISLAVREGLPDIAPVEIEKLADAATADIDARIAHLIGDHNARIVRDYIALRPYRIRAGGFLAGDALTNAEAFEEGLTPEYDKQLEKVARTLREKAPTYFDRYQSPWPDLFPEEAIAAIEPLIPESSRAFLRETNRNILARRRMAEISRDAALLGKIKVREDSLRDYPLATGANPDIK